MKIYKYGSITNTLKCIVGEIEDLFVCNDLSRLHELAIQKYDELFQISKDSITEFHKKFYDSYHAGDLEWIERYYEELIKLAIPSIVNEDFLYQKFPTFRVHLPGNVAVGAFHKDKEFNHPKGEINFIIPLSNAWDTAAVYVESEEDKGDFTPMLMEVGTLIKFDGNNLTHGNKVNIEGYTRVSMDFRILPLSGYKETEGTSMTMQTKFKEGQYYKRFNVSK